MNRFYSFTGITLMLMMAWSASVFGQGYHVKQVITGNSGKFEASPPYTDWVTLQQYHPVNQTGDLFATLFTQSVQDILIVDHFAYVTAQDSIARYNLNTMEQVAIVADAGLNKLALCNGKLVVSKQFPLTQNFVVIRDTADLSLVQEIGGISGDCMGIVSTGDSLYVAVNGGWAGAEGKLAVIDPTDWSLVREINLGTGAVGIAQLYLDGETIISVNKTPWGTTPPAGSITWYTPQTGAFVTEIYDITLGNGFGIHDGLLYVLMNEAIGTIDIATREIADTMVVADPGSAMFTYITSAAVDTINDRIYANIGDYMMPGRCLVTDLDGDSITGYATGISTEVVVIDYRENMTAMDEPAGSISSADFMVYPNPAINSITVRTNSAHPVTGLSLQTISGRILWQQSYDRQILGEIGVDLGTLPSGIYLLRIDSQGIPVSKKVVKQ